VSLRARHAFVAAALALAASPARADEPAGHAVDAASGHRYRVAFDPASRVTLGAAPAVARTASGKAGAAPEIDAGIGYRTVDARGEGRERVAWAVEHRIVTGWVRPAGGPAPHVPALDASLYAVSALRHDELPSIVLPTSPPRGLPFPFDVGFDAEAGRVAVSAFSRADGAPLVHVGVVRAALRLDPWRSGLAGRFFTFGFGARYDVDVSAARMPSAPRVVHRVAPMTEGSVHLRAESDDGLMALDLRGEVAPHWSSAGAWTVLGRSALHLERTLIALGDQPVTTFLDGTYRYDPGTRAAAPASDFRVSLGLALHLALR
jgi:hypothetical protein